jgi:exopolysaccharide biosynthesis polyprenyl glycosylphosphotransferase
MDYRGNPGQRCVSLPTPADAETGLNRASTSLLDSGPNAEVRDPTLAQPREAAPRADAYVGRQRKFMRAHVLRRLLLVADIAAFAVAFAATELAGLLDGRTESFSLSHWAVAVALLPVWIVFLHAHQLYHLDSRRAEYGVAEEIGPILHMTTLWTWGVVLIGAAAGIGDLSLSQMAVFWGAAAVGTTSFRAAVRARARRQLWYLQNTVVVGTTAEISAMVSKILRHPEYGINLVGCVDFTGQDSVTFLGSIPVMRGHVDLLAVIQELDVERVIVAWNAQDTEERFGLIHELSALNVQVDLIPSWFDLLGLKLDIHEMEGTPLLTVPYRSLSRSSLILKRAMDISISGLALVLSAPLFALIALAIKLDSRGPVLFRQQRIGKDGRHFTLLKFRSMFRDAERRKDEVAELNFHGGGNERGLFKIRRDPRITRVGRLLRRASLDELPQLVNVLLGHMSLVGPRPLIENEDRQVEGRFRRRLSLTPGLTGLWQIHGRSEVPFQQMVNLDYLYVTSWSLWGDVRILLKTAAAVFARRGAY